MSDEIKAQVALANRILVGEGVLDVFGHVSMRDPTDPGRYWLSTAIAPVLVQPKDVMAFTLDSQPVVKTVEPLYSERVIHGAIYQARPDVNAICHHHAAAIMPFSISGVAIVPVSQLGATLGRKVPFWDSRDEFGDTNLLIVRDDEAASLARALGPHWAVLMKRHGATNVGRSLKELVFRSVYFCRNAEEQRGALALGAVDALSPGEIDKGLEIRPSPLNRAWDSWAARWKL